MRRPHGQRGVALVCALLMLLAAGTLALSVGRMAMATLASAEGERDRAVARAAAAAALRDAQQGLAGGAGSAAVRAAADPPAWQVLDLRAASDPALVTYGAVTGARMATGGGVLPARLPVYLVERLAQGEGYRVTAAGFGTRTGTTVVLQALVRRPGAGRMGWREIANWPELHARAAGGEYTDERGGR